MTGVEKAEEGAIGMPGALGDTAGAGAAAAAAAALSQPALDAALACGAGIVVDSGFSYTHALPVFQHRVVAPAVAQKENASAPPPPSSPRAAAAAAAAPAASQLPSPSAQL